MHYLLVSVQNLYHVFFWPNLWSVTLDNKPPLDSNATPGAGEKRKGATPLSTEPAGKSSKTQYADVAAS